MDFESILVLARVLHFGSALLMASLLFFQQIVWRGEALSLSGRRLFPVGVRRSLWMALLVQILSGLLWFWIVTADMNGISLAACLNDGCLKTVALETSFGRLWILRLLLGLLLGATFLARRSSLAMIPGFALLVSLAWAGHAASGATHSLVHLLADATHLAVAAVWPGGLFPLALFLFTMNQEPPALKKGLFTVRRFSTISLSAVFFLFVTGLINACFLLPRVAALYTSGYGRLLLLKLFLFFIMLGLGAVNRYVVIPYLNPAGTRSSWRIFLWLVGIENSLIFAVLMVVAIMGAIAPPR